LSNKIRRCSRRSSDGLQPRRRASISTHVSRWPPILAYFSLLYSYSPANTYDTKRKDYVCRCCSNSEEEDGREQAEEDYDSPQIHRNDRYGARQSERARRFFSPGYPQVPREELRRWQKRTSHQHSSEDGAEERREEWLVKAGEGHRRVGQFPTRRMYEAGYCCREKTEGGEEESEEGGKKGDQEPEKGSCEKPQESSEEEGGGEAESGETQSAGQAKEDTRQGEEVYCRQAEEGSACEEGGRQEGVGISLKSALQRPS